MRCPLRSTRHPFFAVWTWCASQTKPSGRSARQGVDVPASSTLERHPGRLCLAVAVAYALGSELAWHSFGANVGLAFFPPAGITVAALLLTRRRHWPALLATVFVTEVLVDPSQHLGTRYALAYAVANTVEPLVGALLVDRMNLTFPSGLAVANITAFFTLGVVFAAA